MRREILYETLMRHTKDVESGQLSKLSFPAIFIKLDEIRRQKYINFVALENLYQPVLLANQY